MNGQMNGFHNSLIEEDCFLFTSESVGEGHPGKKPTAAAILTTYDKRSTRACLERNAHTSRNCEGCVFGGGTRG